ncbi:hypothetical protein K432DRAFT_430496 [Lepidopterella palustris CBS 459.81]|uniref:F-box domain-containing protein n=1 Tax=Lepidopterella palustris CBS 459.81 TaxID=1314670 RepID=A0A8E2DXL9_9PEZI|nr:hypothetical protein K432DRAFT_430496 [Lepidopterella palustris CBS 459.81]
MGISTPALPPTAQTRVLSTPELLEIILLALDTRSLLLAQRISTHFLAVITLSPRIQHKLFFRPRPVSSKLFPHHISPSPSPSTETSWILNPLLALHFPLFFLPKHPSSWYDLPTYDSFGLLPWAESEELRERFMRPEASWRRMLVTQPPSTRLGVVKTVSSRGRERGVAGWVEAEGDRGVTMAMLYDIALAFVSWHRVSSFGTQVHNPPSSPSKFSPGITLQLHYVSQCCQRAVRNRPELESRAERTYSPFTVEFKNVEKGDAGSGGEGERKWEWDSDLTAEMIDG